MSDMIVIPPAFTQLAPVLQDMGGGDDLSAGVGGGFGIITYRGKVWRTKYRGEETVLMREDGDGPRASIDVVIVKAAPNLSKIFYEQGFVEGSNSAPDCFSTNGLTPDPSVNKKQAAACAACPRNAWGSRISESGKAGKQCADSKRLAVVPATDMVNEINGGPMLLRVPAASLQDMAAFGQKMQQLGFPYYSFITRIRFDVEDAFPKFVFEPVRPLTEDEAKIMLDHRSAALTTRILSEAVEEVRHETAKPDLGDAAALFNQAAAETAAKTQAQVEALKTTSQKAVEVMNATPRTTAPPPERAAPKVVSKTEAAPVASAAAKRPKFDPDTGELIVYPDEAPAAAPVTAAPAAEAEAVAETSVANFDAMLDNLMGQ